MEASCGKIEILVATRGDRVAHIGLLAKRGEGIGNRLLVTRLLHIAIFAFRAAGITELMDIPANGRLTAHYAAMGFENGRQLNLVNAASLTKAFEYVEMVYEQYGLDLNEPPLPL